ncbi:MAG TPA: sulfotransferase [Nocardioides sp.]
MTDLRPADLTPTNLMTAASDKTGLSEFGDDWFVEPLGVLTKSLDQEARLSDLGRDLTRKRLIGLLVDRLRLRAFQREHPEVRDVEVDVAAAICGLPRTGSTLLHRLLASSPQLTATLSWETTYPLPFPGEGPDAEIRKRRARERILLFKELSPEFSDIHDVVWDGPEEDVILVDRSFTSMSFDSFYWVPSYGEWLRAADQGRAYAELREWLQVLQWQDPSRAGRRWVLKSPHHLSALESVLDTFDGCKIVMTHRTPTSAVPSYASMVRNISSQYSDAVEPVAIGRYWSDMFVRSLTRFAEVRAARPERFVDVLFDQMTTEPAARARGVLAEVGVAPGPDDDAAIKAYVEKDRRERHASHTYAVEDFGLSTAQLEREFAFYTEEYL